jgi:hypothetical protein
MPLWVEPVKKIRNSPGGNRSGQKTHTEKSYTLNAVKEASALPPLFRSEGTSDAMALYPGHPCHILYQQIVAILSWNRIAAWKENKPYEEF